MSHTIHSLNGYQSEARRTMLDNWGQQDRESLSCHGLGIAGEAGEVADLIKKHLHHGHPLDREKLIKELGDVLWYVAAVAKDIGVDLSEVAEANVMKLRKRYPDGFSQERSINREETTK